jgi:hypothetical protein
MTSHLHQALRIAVARRPDNGVCVGYEQGNIIVGKTVWYRIWV